MIALDKRHLGSLGSRIGNASAGGSGGSFMGGPDRRSDCLEGSDAVLGAYRYAMSGYPDFLSRVRLVKAAATRAGTSAEDGASVTTGFPERRRIPVRGTVLPLCDRFAVMAGDLITGLRADRPLGRGLCRAADARDGGRDAGHPRRRPDADYKATDYNVQNPDSEWAVSHDQCTRGSHSLRSNRLALPPFAQRDPGADVARGATPGADVVAGPRRGHAWAAARYRTGIMREARCLRPVRICFGRAYPWSFRH